MDAEEMRDLEWTNLFLSICISTYNRSKYLRRCINSIISQKEFQDNMVEIIICDNASEDDTERDCKKYTEEFWNIKYLRNIENMGNRHFAKILGMGQGRLRRLCNDILISAPGSLNDIYLRNN